MTRMRVRRKNEWVRNGDTTIPVDPPPPPAPGLIFAEEFLTPISSSWGVYNDTYGSGNKEIHWYDPANMVVEGGRLKITAKRETKTGSSGTAPAMAYTTTSGANYAAPETGLPAGTRYYTSGFMGTRDAAVPKYFPLFCRFEIRCTFPHGQGFLPAFWLRRIGGASWAEVDIVEYFFNYRPGEGRFTLHFPNSIGGNAYSRQRFFDTPVLGSSNMHVWAVEITPANENPDPLLDPIWFKAYCDGVEYGAYKVTNVTTIRDLHMIDRSTGTKIDPANPTLTWDMAVNLAVGGRWVGHPAQQLGYLPIVDRCSKNQSGPPSGAGAGASCNISGLFFPSFPAVMEVDYIRVYDLGN